jgi:hypothetical protein
LSQKHRIFEEKRCFKYLELCILKLSGLPSTRRDGCRRPIGPFNSSDA